MSGGHLAPGQTSFYQILDSLQYLTLELAQQEADHHEEGEAGEAGEDDEDGLLQPGGRLGVAALIAESVLAVIET